MTNPIQILYSPTATNAPTLGIGATDSNIGLNGPDELLYYFNGTTTEKFKLNQKESLGFAGSDEITDLTTGAAKTTYRMPYAFLATEYRISVNTAPTGSVIQVDINKNGITVFTTELTIDATEKTSVTAAVPAVIAGGSTTWADDDEITIDITTVGSTIAGKGLKITILGKQI